MRICSNWKVVWESIAILNFDDEIDGEPDLSQSRTTDRIALFRSQYIDAVERRNIGHTLSFTKIYAGATVTAARAAALDVMIALAAKTAGDLTLTIGNDGELDENFVIAGATLQPLSLSPDLTSGGMVAINYSFTGGQLSHS